MINIYIFGTGSGREKFEMIMNKQNINIIAYVDNDKEKQNSNINGIDIISPSEIDESKYDYLLIASEYYEAIFAQLERLGIHKNILYIYKNCTLEEYLDLFSIFITLRGINLIKKNYEYFGHISYNYLTELKFYPTKNKLVKMMYRNNKNYKIEFNLQNECEENLCVIYFSSIGVYYPDVECEFVSKIIDRDNYEWYNTRIKRAKKHIFIRDIYKQWYIKGINSEIDNMNKLLEFLRKETMNYNVICVGSSAGGYAAILAGIFLNSQYVLSFSSQFNLNTKICRKIEKRNLDGYPYNDLSDLIKKVLIPIFYFYPCKSSNDREQYKFIKECNSLYTFILNEKEHGVPLSKENLKFVMNLTLDELTKLHRSWNGKLIENKSFYELNNYKK